MIPVVLAFLPCCSDTNETLSADADPQQSDFIQFVEEGEFSGHLDTAVVTYENDDGCRVDLIAAVHVADPGYYESLQVLFSGYDGLLYELIADEDAIPRPGEGDDNFLSRLQHGLCQGLNLAFQLEAIDYTPANFIHADLTPEKFARLFRERGESFLGIFFKVLRAQLAARSEGMGQHLTGAAIIEAFRSEDSSKRLKYILAQEMKHIEGMFAGIESEEKERGQDGSLLLGERNKAAIEVLEREMKRGRKKLAIFYGAAHMTDFELRLVQDLGFKKVRHNWLAAWDI